MAKEIPAATIGEHGVIGNMLSAALVNVYGEIDFFCFPEFDSPTVFGSLLDSKRAGCFSIRPAGSAAKGAQMYLPDTNVLLTRFLSKESILEVCDFMPVIEDSDRHCLVRTVTAVYGNVDIELHCQPAFDYARAAHRTQTCPGGFIFQTRDDTQAPLRLRGTAALHAKSGSVFSSFRLEEGQTRYFVLDSPLDEEDDLEGFAKDALDQTRDYWTKWVSRSLYKGRWREAVTRSALTLKLLTSSKHGGILAAATFGLPEAPGGPRNWDYRFVWMRDAAFTSYAFSRLGYVAEGQKFHQWLQKRVGDFGEHGPLDVMYRADGSSNLQETELAHLAGYRDSKPVRIGNGASKQLQLDIYGELFDSGYLSSKYGDGIPYENWLKMKEVLRWLAGHWRDPDEGIWEVRGGRKEFLHSRLMCWVAFDRAIRLGQKRSLAGPFDWMTECRDAIVTDIHENFWNADLGAFVQYKGANDVDAATLLMPLLRFISVNDKRWLSTLEVIERHLVTGTAVRRYTNDNSVDGLPGREAGFTACAFWLVEAKARSHQVDEARLLFQKLLNQSNPLGLFAEQLDITGEQLGNFPQALSHLALISAATYLDRKIGNAQTSSWE